MLDDNKRSHELYLKVLDFSDLIKRTLPQERDDFFKEYQQTLKDICVYYQQIYDRIEGNMAAVSSALRLNFKT